MSASADVWRVSLQQFLSEKPFTISNAAWILSLDLEYEAEEERTQLQHLVQQAISAVDFDDLPKASHRGERADKREIGLKEVDKDIDIDINKVRVKVYTDFEILEEVEQFIAPQVQLVKAREEGDFLFICERITNFLGYNQRVCQFPYEGGYVRKDLLPLTVRGYCYNLDDKGRANAWGQPFWWLDCFDLSTEWHFFQRCYERKLSEGASNNWIIKPSVGTRAMGHRIVYSPDSSSRLADIAKFAPQYKFLLPEEVGDGPVGAHIAQQLVTEPLLVDGVKWDYRVIVVVRSYEPFEAYMHEAYYARLANKKYDPALLGSDPQVGLTVCCYDEDEEIRNAQRRMTKSQLRDRLVLQGVDWAYMEQGLQQLLYELFSGVGSSVGKWPLSSAYYAVDVVYDSPRAGGGPAPKLLEVNFMGDLKGVHICSDSEGDYHQELILALATQSSLDEGRWRRLRRTPFGDSLQ